MFKFINLNIWDHGILLEGAINFINKENPDILALQEVCNGNNKSLQKGLRSLSILKENLNLQHCTFSPAFFEMHGEKIENGNVIFSKFPIIKENTTFYDISYIERSLDDTEYSRTPRNLQHATIKIGNKTLNIFNTHGIWGINGKDNERRLKMCQTIVSKIKNEKNVILSGDFNIDINTRSVNLIEQHIKNVFKNRLKTSFNMKIKTDTKFSKSVVDMIFISKEIKLIDSYCPQVNVSDHLPLIITFDF